MSTEPTTAVAIRDGGTVATTTPDVLVPGIEDFGREDFVVPRLRLVQAQSTFSDRVGMIFNNLTNEAVDDIDVVVIGLRRSRIRWPEGPFSRDQKAVCASDDAKIARPNMAGADFHGVPTQECTKCIYSAWRDGANGKRQPPLCSLTYNFLVVDVTDDLPALISFARTSAHAGKMLATMVRAYGYRRAYRIGVAKEENDIGKYYVYTVTKGGDVVPDHLQHYVHLAEQYRSVEINADDGTDGGDTSFNPAELES